MTEHSYLVLYDKFRKDPRFSQLPDHIWRRSIEWLLFQNACETGEIELVEDRSTNNGREEVRKLLGWLPGELLMMSHALREAGIVKYYEVMGLYFEGHAETMNHAKACAMGYSDYLKSEHWHCTRGNALRQGYSTCIRCGKGTELNVHHLTYDNIGEERPEDLTVLCNDCHKQEHGIDND